MSQNWYQGQSGQYGQQPQQQQTWGNQQGWVQGGQWAGQPHPQQAGFYGNQQQFQMGFQQGQPQQFPQQQFQAQSFARNQPQSFGPQQGQQLSFSQQPQHSGHSFGQQPGQQQQAFAVPQNFGQAIPPQQLPSGPQQQGGGRQFLTQQAYAQEYERRVREEKKKKEIEEQKKKLQSLKVATKQSVNLDDLFEKQLPEVSRAPPPSVVHSTPPPHTVSDRGDGSGTMQSVSSDTGDSENTIGTVDGGVTTSETNTAETIQKLMTESLDITGSGKPKKVQFKPSAFKQQQQHSSRKEAVQSTKARSWDTEDFSGVFAQHQPEQPLQEGDNFGDFQSSGHQLPGSNTQFPPFSAGNEHSQVNPPENLFQPGSHVIQGGSHTLQPGSHMMQGESHIMQPGSHMMQSGSHMMQSENHMTQPGSHMVQGGSHMMQSENHMTQPGSHMMQGGSHMIATSAYQGPLSSTNVLHGMQGQAPNSPSKQATAHTVDAHSQFNQTNNTLPKDIAREPGIYSPQVSNFSPSGSPGPPQSPPSSQVDTMSRFHPVYHKVYRLCRKQGEENVSTELLYPVLLSSKLSRVLLRDLWSRANKGKPGQLDRTELFVLLGLVALAQNGNNNPTLEDLKRVSSMPIPTLPALSTLSPPASSTVTHPLSTINNDITAKDDEFGQFHSSMNPSNIQQPATSTHTTLLPQPVSIPVHSTSISNPAPAGLVKPYLKPVEPVIGLMQPMTASYNPPTTPPTNNTPSDKYAAFGELQSMGLQATPNIPNNINATSANPSVPPITNDVNLAESGQLITPIPGPPPPSVPTSQVNDKFIAFDNLRQSKSPLPNPLMTSGGQVQSLESRTPLGNPQWITQPPTTQPILSSSQLLNLEPSDSRLPSSPPSTLAINSHTPTSIVAVATGQSTTLANQSLPFHDTSWSKGSHKQTQDDDFGDFAQFSSAFTSSSLQTTPSIITSTAFSTTLHPVSSSFSSVGAADSLYLNTSEITGKSHATLDGKEQVARENDGWADFEHFSSAPIQLTNTATNPTQLSANVTQQTLLGNNEQESLFDQSTQSQTPVDSKSRGFEFLRPGTPGSIPTIDDMEKQLLSKLTPTLPRKQRQSQQSMNSEDQVEKSEIQKTIEKPSTNHPHNKPVAGALADEEGWRVCLMKCAEVLGTCVDVLKDVEEKSLLQEIAQSEESQSKLHSIAEVYRFAKRIYATIHAKNITKAVSETEEVRKYWQDLNSLLPENAMEKVYRSTQPPCPTTETVTDVLSDTISQCAICLMSKTVSIASSLSLDGLSEEYNISLLFHNGQTYHAPCANFWRHFVSEDVPVLR